MNLMEITVTYMVFGSVPALPDDLLKDGKSNAKVEIALEIIAVSENNTSTSSRQLPITVSKLPLNHMETDQSVLPQTRPV